MSRPGFWKTKEGTEMPISGMGDMHIKHVSRFLWRMIGGMQPGSRLYRENEDKLIEMGNEAQTRNLLPQGDITIDQLKGYVAGWQAEWDGMPRSHVQPIQIITPPPPQPEPAEPTWAQADPTAMIAAVQARQYIRGYPRRHYKQEPASPVAVKKQREEVDPNERRLDPDL